MAFWVELFFTKFSKIQPEYYQLKIQQVVNLAFIPKSLSQNTTLTIFSLICPKDQEHILKYVTTETCCIKAD